MATNDVDSPPRFHQMQCLAVFRQVLQAQQEGLDIGSGEKEIPHAQLCLDYMYQVWGLSCESEATVREADKVPIS
jgi:hypothetical protein